MFRYVTMATILLSYSLTLLCSYSFILLFSYSLTPYSLTLLFYTNAYLGTSTSVEGVRMCMCLIELVSFLRLSHREVTLTRTCILTICHVIEYIPTYDWVNNYIE